MESVLQVGVHVDVKPSSMSLEENVTEYNTWSAY